MQPKNILENIFQIDREGGMRVPARIFASQRLIEQMKRDKTLHQARNMAFLPGIYKYAIVLPDAHQGYGFPIGGVTALDAEEGVISPGGIGYDINCGVRVVKTNLTYADIKGRENQILNILFNKVPLGLGKGESVKVSRSDFDEIMASGMRWAYEKNYAVEDDLKHAEESGSMKADPSKVSDRAISRGINQVGSLGSGNHFIEVQRIVNVYDNETATKFGLSKDQIVVMIHTGSRGFGHQICSDYLRLMEKKYQEIIRGLPDRELIYSPVNEQPAQDYYEAMKCAANFAWNNRQLLTYNVRNCFSKLFGRSWEDLGMGLLYDVAHNIAKIEVHPVDGKNRRVYIHRKGATRSFAPGMKEIPAAYRTVGQPVLIPGSMGTASYVLVGTEKAIELTFGSTAHGAGRTLSRHAAKKTYRGETVSKDLLRKKIYVKCRSGFAGLAEESPGAYKDIDEVVRVSHDLGIGKLVVKMVPVVNIKG